MRFEVVAAYFIGAGLPILETIRRGLGHWLENATTMAEDYIAGGLLLTGAWLVTQRHRYGLVILTAAWAYSSGMMFGSFWWPFERTLRGLDAPGNDALVISIKAILWLTCVTGLLLSLRRLLPVMKRLPESAL